MVVTATRASKSSQLAQELRIVRRRQDRFVYESVVVGSFEDGLLGAILNAWRVSSYPPEFRLPRHTTVPFFENVSLPTSFRSAMTYLGTVCSKVSALAASRGGPRRTNTKTPPGVGLEGARTGDPIRTVRSTSQVDNLEPTSS